MQSNIELLKEKKVLNVRHNESGFHWKATNPYGDGEWIRLEADGGRRYEIKCDMFNLEYSPIGKTAISFAFQIPGSNTFLRNNSQKGALQITFSCADYLLIGAMSPVDAAEKLVGFLGDDVENFIPVGVK